MAKKGIVLTGDRPTGKLHLGHFVGSIKSRLSLQDEYEQFIMVADMQALTDNADNPEKVRNSVFEVVLDNIAAGLDPAKTHFFIQSRIPEIASLNMLFQNLITYGRLMQNPTVKTEMKDKQYEGNVPVGFLTYPISQAADILAFKPDLVPVGNDQLPMIELTNEVVEKFNRIYGDTFQKVKAISADKNSAEARLPGIDGSAKMGKSLNNAIYLSDTEEVVQEKIMNMYTDPDHVHVEDPGRVGGNVVFTYLDVFDQDKESLANLKEKYKAGGLGDVEIKKRLIKVINDFLDPIRERREHLSTKPDFIKDVVKEGEEVARRVVQATYKEVTEAMGINYY